MKILASNNSNPKVVRLLDEFEDDNILYDFLRYKESSVMHEYPFVDIEVPKKELDDVENFLWRNYIRYLVF